MEDTEIIDMLFSRDESAIDEARAKYGRRLFKTAKNILHSNEDAEECVNDTLMKAWESIPPTRPAMFGAYLVKITRNLALNRWEARSAARRGGGQANLLLAELQEVLPSADTPERVSESRECIAAINEFLGGLDYEVRAVFILRYFHGESIADIGARHNMSESKAKSLLFRIRKKLKEHLEKEGVMI